MLSNNRAMGIVLSDGTVREYDHIVSSAPFTDMLCSIDAIPAEIYSTARELTYRNTTLVYLQVNRENVFKDNWIYVHDTSVQMGRVTNFQNWSAKMTKGRKETILCLEYWSYDRDELWNMSEKDLIDLAIDDMTKTGLVAKDDIMNGHVVKLHRSYPVYSTGYQKRLNILQEAADRVEGISFIGRNGSFKYNNQDHSILMGLLVAENILAGTRKNNLWHVNTDYDYQEGKSNLVDSGAR